jgi:D-amino peptidase
MKRPLKVFLSFDMEGITGITHWDEATKGRCDYSCFFEQMTNEAVAAAMHRVQGGIRRATS